MDRADPITAEYLIAVFDLNNFAQIARKHDSGTLFGIINEIQIKTIRKLKDHNPLIVKNIGDANLLVFEADDVDHKVKALYKLKETLEEYLSQQGWNNKFSFSCHVGNVTLGVLGEEPFQTFDAFGDAINVTWVMNGKPYKGRFNISPQLFRKLSSETRKMFHKFTPQIVYLAE